MDEAEFERIGAPISLQLPLCLADEAGTAHSVAGNLGHRGMLAKHGNHLVARDGLGRSG